MAVIIINIIIIVIIVMNARFKIDKTLNLIDALCELSLTVNIDIKGDLMTNQQFNIKRKETPSAWVLQHNDEASSLPSYLLSVQACHTPDECLLFASERWRKIKTGVFSFSVIERAGTRHLASPFFWYRCLYSARLMNLPKLCNSSSERDRSSPAM